MKRAFILACCLLISISNLVFGQRDLKNIPDPDPELERSSFIVAEGFEVNLFAGDPLLAKPIQMNFDSQGRLWIASSEVYPQIKPGQKANDKILILEDADGDGVADKTTVFADGLLIPTGVEPGDGGAYVANSTELLHMRDTDGDGRADTSRVMLSGFGTEDTHHILHTLRWGPEGLLYFNQSIYIHSHIETPHGVRRLNGGGIWQFRPETMQLEVVMRGLVNTWGHHFDRWGQSFATDGAGGEGINFLVPGAAYVTNVGVPRVIRGLNPGSPKYCGLEIISGRHLPEDWQGNAITNDFRGHRVCRFVLSDDGSAFAAREQSELIKTTHVAFRPIDVKMGPDGAIYIADWYNPIIQHGEVDFRDERRDHTHGRIWRITAKNQPLVARPQLVGAETKELLKALEAPEKWTRQHAKRVLKARGTAVLPELASWLEQLDPQDPGSEHHRLEALWTYQALDVPEPALLETLLRSADFRVRAAATRVVPLWSNRLPNPLALLSEQVTDEHPRVRLEAVCALRLIPQARSVELAMQALDRPVDKYLDYALWMTARELQPYWLPALQAGELSFDGNSRHLTFALESAGAPAVVKPLLASWKKGEITGNREEGVLELVAALGGGDDLAVILQTSLEKGDPRLLSVLASAATQRKTVPAGDLSQIASLLDAKDEAAQEITAKLIGLWKLANLRGELTTLTEAGDTRPGLRRAAIEGLALLGDEASATALRRLTDATFPTEVRQEAAVALAAVDLKIAAGIARELLQEADSSHDPAPLIEAFLERKEGPAQLIAALENQKLSEDIAKLALRTVRNSARVEPALADAISKSGGLAAAPVPLTPEQLAEMVADVQRLGNAQRGEAVFRREDQGCFRCHAIGGAGGQVGPDLVSLGASAQVDYLIDSLLLPNKQVKENYHSLVVVDDDARVYTGIKVRQTDTQLVLRNAEDKEVVIPLDKIDEQVMGGSIMPAGLTDPLTRGEMLDLVRFLSELGKVGPFAIGKARVVRRWQTLEASPATTRRLGFVPLEAVTQEHPAFSWKSAYSQVGGSLPLAELPAIPIPMQPHRTAFLRAELDVTTPGLVRLDLGTAAGVILWVDGTAVPVDAQTDLTLTRGVHRLTFAIDVEEGKTDFRCELIDVPGSPAQAQIVGGK